MPLAGDTGGQGTAVTTRLRLHAQQSFVGAQPGGGPIPDEELLLDVPDDDEMLDGVLELLLELTLDELEDDELLDGSLSVEEALDDELSEDDGELLDDSPLDDELLDDEPPDVELLDDSLLAALLDDPLLAPEPDDSLLDEELLTDEPLEKLTPDELLDDELLDEELLDEELLDGELLDDELLWDELLSDEPLDSELELDELPGGLPWSNSPMFVGPATVVAAAVARSTGHFRLKCAASQNSSRVRRAWRYARSCSALTRPDSNNVQTCAQSPSGRSGRSSGWRRRHCSVQYDHVPGARFLYVARSWLTIKCSMGAW